MKSGIMFPTAGNIANCPEHKDKTIEFFCGDHQLPCCSFCVGIKHRKCQTVETRQSRKADKRKL
jgi:hypothetical protein